MAKLVSNNETLEIRALGHHYTLDGSDTNEFHYEVILYKDGIQRCFPLERNDEMLDLFDVETLDTMISQVCFNAIQHHTEDSVHDTCYACFSFFVKPNGLLWDVIVDLNPYYLTHRDEFVFTFTVSEEALFTFAKALRLEEAKAIAHRK